MSSTPPPEAVSNRRAERHRTRAAAFVVMGSTLASRVVGLVREVIVAAIFGAGATMSAFAVAFQIPNLIRSFVADMALPGSIVPVFTELVEEGHEERAWRVASTIATLILLVMTPVIVLSMVAAPWIVDLAVHDKFGQMELAIDLFRIMIPLVVLMSLAGVVIGVLNSYGHFSTPALAPVAWNAVVIVMLLVGTHLVDSDHRIHVYAAGVLVGSVVQMLLPMPWLRGRGGRLRVVMDVKDPAVKAVLMMMLPVSISLALINLTAIVNTYFSTSIPPGVLPAEALDAGPALIDKAFRIFQLPQGIFALAVSTVFFPLFARYSARDDMDGFRRACADGLRQLVVLLLPAAGLLFLLAGPIVRLLYGHGAWQSWQTPLVADALRGFAIGLVVNGAILLLMRAFYSLRKPWLPVYVGLLNFGATVLFAWLLHAHWGVWGIALATSLANILAFLTMYILLARRLGGLHTPTVLWTFIAGLAASIPSCVIGYEAWRQVHVHLGRGTLPQVLGMTVALVVTYGLYLFVATRLRLISVQTLKSIGRRTPPVD